MNVHAPALLDLLSEQPSGEFSGAAYRATPLPLDPLTPSFRAGRWMPADYGSVLYTSLAREGALAEIAFHWALQTPMPSKPVKISRLQVTTLRTLRLLRPDLTKLGVDMTEYGTPFYSETQKVGAAVKFLGFDGVIVPNARWNCDNLVLMMDNCSGAVSIEMISSEEVAWQDWARSHGMLKP